ncbi:MAG TPA: BamA/TamA family outer membrane protein [Bacteroidota bacterium]|nr:BamA/TamA family outer membrane protein [Bacteroidota bacterium]
MQTLFTKNCTSITKRLSTAFFLFGLSLLFPLSQASASDSAAVIDSLRQAPETVIADSTLRVADVVFIGNELTKDYVIDREMSLKPGSFVTGEALKYDIERIYSLQLFTRVNIYVQPLDSATARLMVVVNERWYFYPFPVVGLKDHDWNHIYYGLGVAHNNVGGQAIQMACEFALGYDPYVTVGFYHPSISSDRTFFLSSHLSYSIQKNKSLVALSNGPNFDEKRVSADFGIGRRLSLFSMLSLTAEYFSLQVSDNKAGRTMSDDGTDRFLALHAAYKYDTRDLAEYPNRGVMLKAGISKYGLGGTVDMQRYSADLRSYVPLFGDVVAAGRVFGNIAGGGRVPNYGHVYFGYADRIRGHYQEILEGEHVIGSTAELHIPLLSPRYYRLEAMPIEQFRDIRYALNFALFADAGTVWYREQPLALHNVTSGFGAGFHILFAYSVVFRLEYAFQENFKSGQAIFTVGAAL